MCKDKWSVFTERIHFAMFVGTAVIIIIFSNLFIFDMRFYLQNVKKKMESKHRIALFAIADNRKKTIWFYRRWKRNREQNEMFIRARTIQRKLQKSLKQFSSIITSLSLHFISRAIRTTDFFETFSNTFPNSKANLTFPPFVCGTIKKQQKKIAYESTMGWIFCPLLCRQKIFFFWLNACQFFYWLAWIWSVRM